MRWKLASLALVASAVLAVSATSAAAGDLVDVNLGVDLWLEQLLERPRCALELLGIQFPSNTRVAASLFPDIECPKV